MDEITWSKKSFTNHGGTGLILQDLDGVAPICFLLLQ